MTANRKAILVSVQTPNVSDEEVESSLAELKRLCQTLGYEVIGTMVQRRKTPSPATAVGSGKLRELARLTGGTGKVKSFSGGKNFEEEIEEVDDLDADLEEALAPDQLAGKIVFDQELSPNQLKHLEEATGAEVLDRTGVIVEIFSRHAKTREAKAQVEIARLKYLAPRLRATGGTADRQGGGIGGKGAGETTYELDKRRSRDRIAELMHELEDIRADQLHRRERRQNQLSVALVGYTNAGKSSLMRALTGNLVLVADKLFATLDTTVRAMQPDIYPRILVSDTVGFIQKLPHDLVASFRSTLDEAADATLLLYVVDASDPSFRQQFEVTKTVLKEINAGAIPSRLILNKVDCLNVVETALLAREFPDAIRMSTRNPDDVDRLKRIIRAALTDDLAEAEVLIPYDDKNGLVGELRRNALVVAEAYEETGIRFKIRAYAETLVRLNIEFKRKH